ncbi:hypothetical protein EON67_03575, partial [archaeon]
MLLVALAACAWRCVVAVQQPVLTPQLPSSHHTVRSAAVMLPDVDVEGGRVTVNQFPLSRARSACPVVALDALDGVRSARLGIHCRVVTTSLPHGDDAQTAAQLCNASTALPLPSLHCTSRALPLDAQPVPAPGTPVDALSSKRQQQRREQRQQQQRPSLRPAAECALPAWVTALAHSMQGQAHEPELLTTSRSSFFISLKGLRMRARRRQAGAADELHSAHEQLELCGLIHGGTPNNVHVRGWACWQLVQRALESPAAVRAKNDRLASHLLTCSLAASEVTYLNETALAHSAAAPPAAQQQTNSADGLYA